MTFSVFYILTSIITGIIDVLFSAAAFRRHSKAGRCLGMTFFFTVTSDAFYLISVLSTNKLIVSISSSFYFFSIVWMLIYLVCFVRSYGLDCRTRLGNSIIVLLMILAVFDSFIELTNPLTEWSIDYLAQDTTIAHFTYDMHLLYYGHLALSYALVVYIFILFLQKSILSPRIYRSPYLYSMIGILIVVAINAGFLFLPKHYMLSKIDLSVLFYSVAAAFLYWANFHHASHGMMNLFRSWVFDNASQGIVLFDYNGCLILQNKNVKNFLPDIELNDDTTIEEFIKLTGIDARFMTNEDDNTFQLFSQVSQVYGSAVYCDYHTMRSGDRENKVIGRAFSFYDNGKVTDPLTGFETWNNFYNSRKKGVPHTIVAVCDFNKLQTLNTDFGRQEGDRAIGILADIMRETFPENTYFIRGREAALYAFCRDLDAQEIKKKLQEISEKISSKEYYQGTLRIQTALAEVGEDGDRIQAVKDAFTGMRIRKMMDSHSEHSELVTSLIQAQKESDTDTEAHVRRTQIMGEELGERLNLNDLEQCKLSLLCILHDIGKIGIPLEILNKPGKLTEAEWKTIQSHTTKGYQIAKCNQGFSDVAEAILYHHERWDGHGYPEGLREEEIPLLSRIIAVVDSYDAMVNDRSYRKAVSIEAARAELIRCAGTQFDPNVVNEFVHLLDEQIAKGNEAYGVEKVEDREVVIRLHQDLVVPLGADQIHESMNVHNIPYSCYTLNSDNEIVSVDDNFELLTGYSAEDVKNFRLNQIDLIPEEDRNNYVKEQQKAMKASGTGRVFLEHQIKKKDGTRIYVSCFGRQYFASAEREGRSEILITDLSKISGLQTFYGENNEGLEKEKEEQKAQKCDSLTGLPVHELMRTDVNLHLLQGKSRVLLIVADIENFGEYNADHGLEKGDQLLVRVARNIQSGLRENDKACRVGGGEFAAAIYFSANVSEKAIEDRVKNFELHLNRRLRTEELKIQINMGTAISAMVDTGGDTFTTLFAKAHTNMRQKR